jgi:hypothetical protein
MGKLAASIPGKAGGLIFFQAAQPPLGWFLREEVRLSEDLHWYFPLCLLDQSDKGIVVTIGFKESLSPRATIEDMEEVAGLGESGSSRHNGSTVAQRQGSGVLGD